jgi:hypothetical protein
MLSSSATANDKTVKRNVMAKARTGMPIQRGLGVSSTIPQAYMICRRVAVCL